LHKLITEVFVEVRVYVILRRRKELIPRERDIKGCETWFIRVVERRVYEF